MLPFKTGLTFNAVLFNIFTTFHTHKDLTRLIFGLFGWWRVASSSYFALWHSVKFDFVRRVAHCKKKLRKNKSKQSICSPFVVPLVSATVPQCLRLRQTWVPVIPGCNELEWKVLCWQVLYSSSRYNFFEISSSRMIFWDQRRGRKLILLPGSRDVYANLHSRD